MTSRGYFMAITRHGINRAETGPLHQVRHSRAGGQWRRTTCRGRPSARGRSATYTPRPCLEPGCRIWQRIAQSRRAVGHADCGSLCGRTRPACPVWHCLRWAPGLQASFEETNDILFRAATYAERDIMAGVSENILMGQLCPVGTGAFSLLIDEDKLQGGKGGPRVWAASAAPRLHGVPVAPSDVPCAAAPREAATPAPPAAPAPLCDGALHGAPSRRRH